MKNSIYSFLSFYSKTSPSTPVFGLARSILALGTFLTIAFNGTDNLFINFEEAVSSNNPISNFGLREINLFRILGYENLFVAKVVSIVILLAVIIGWRPRITGILHWWVSLSFASASSTIDGGDTVASIISFFFIPLCLADRREWHWSKSINDIDNPYLVLFLWSLLFIIRLQISVIYLHAGIEKLQIEEWRNGTCTYYWFTNNIYGAANWLQPFVKLIMAKSVVVVFITWGTIVFEIILGMAIIMDRKQINWKLLLLLGVVFHLGILLVFGLISFFMSMTSCLVIYLVPVSRFTTKSELINIFNFKSISPV